MQSQIDWNNWLLGIHLVYEDLAFGVISFLVHDLDNFAFLFGGFDFDFKVQIWAWLALFHWHHMLDVPNNNCGWRKGWIN